MEKELVRSLKDSAQTPLEDCVQDIFCHAGGGEGQLQSHH